MGKAFRIKSLKPQVNLCKGCYDCCPCAPCRRGRGEFVEKSDWEGDQYDRLCNNHLVWIRGRRRESSTHRCGGSKTK